MSLLTNTFRKASVKNPREMIIFSYPKVGKTELFTKLPGSYVILDFEGGSDYYDASAVSVPDLETFSTLRKEFITTSPYYDFIVLDTLTSLYAGIVNSIAVSLYNADEKKSKPLDFDITTLAYGVGYSYKRNALQKVIMFFRQYCKTLILAGHVADKALDSDGSGLMVKDLDIEGKLKNILALKTDAIALLSRTSENENTLSFISSTSLIGGTRAQHLANKDIKISKKLPTGELETYWDQVFIKEDEQLESK